MTQKDEALQILKDYNAWRRDKGDTENLVMPDSKKIDEAIDVAITVLSEPETVTLPKIDYDADMDRYYIPMSAGWEMQTKGKGSSFRLCDTKTGKRYHVEGKWLQQALEQMAREIHDAINLDSIRLDWLQENFDSALTRENIVKAMIASAPKLNTSPPKREWRGLNDEDIEKLNDVFGYFKYGDAQGAKSVEFYKAIEAKLKELNHES